MGLQSHYTLKGRGPSTTEYTLAKRANILLADVLRRNGEGAWVNVRQCATTALVRWCPECGTTHIAGAMCCHHRLCPICQVRRSRRLAADALAAINLLRLSDRLNGVSLYLLTLTQVNVPDGGLADELDRLLDALTRLRHTRDWRRDIAGSARNVEITRNLDPDSPSYKTWHPHVHIVLMIRDGSAMVNESYWRSLWTRTLNLSYDPICNIEPIVDDGAVYEVSKYVSKSVELLTRLPESERVSVIGELNAAIKGRNLVAYTGLWRTARRELSILDDEFADLELDPDDDCKCGGAIMHAMMVWRGNEYVLDPAAHL